MHNRIAATAAILAFFVMAGVALAQNADKNSAGPTKNDLKIRVIEPLEGATITGTSARVSVDYDRSRYREQAGNVDKGLDKFPPPTFSVFLDNDLVQTLKPGETVATVDNISPGSHKIVILAKNISGEVIDRKEINVTAVSVRMIEPHPVVKEVPKEPAVMPAYEPPAAPAPMEATTHHAKTLPRTASNAPGIGLAGIVLIACGLLLARKVR